MALEDVLVIQDQLVKNKQ